MLRIEKKQFGAYIFSAKKKLMRLRSVVFLLLFLCCVPGLRAQTILFAENFDNACVLPAGWVVNLTGNQNPVWYVGAGLQNNDQNGLSMNGSCFLVVDDDATGDATPAYTCAFITPAFDASQYSQVTLSLDVHYRDYGPANESFQVLVTDGVTETLLKSFAQGGSTGDSLFEYTTLKYDLSFFSASPTTKLIFRYDDGGGFAWWAGVDNIQVVGGGLGKNILKETFNGCAKPAGWETQIVTGNDDWLFGYETNPKTTYAGTSMDGSCMAFFDDDLLGGAAPYSTVRLMSPWFDGAQFGRFELSFDIIMRYYSEKISILVQHGDGTEYLVREAAFDIGGPHFPNYVRSYLDLSPYRSQQMRVVFEYDDGQDYAWWIGLDNVKITGSGVANDVCLNAQTLITGPNCQVANNETALFEGPLPACIEKPVAALWYTWQADFTGLAGITTGANFNDVVNVFTGDCTAPQPLLCDNRDEHGFTGEHPYFHVINDSTYLIRVCGKEGGFGVSRGNLCLKIEQILPAITVPVNDQCADAITLSLDAPCVVGTNANALTSATIPTSNELARADIWYAFKAPLLGPGELLVLKSNANFSDVMTVYAGQCQDLTEITGNHKGGTLENSSLVAGQDYYLQISGSFATIEGAVCPQLFKKTAYTPDNDNCLAATAIIVGGACTAGSNIGASFSGNIPPCVALVDHDIWFKFVAPASGGVRINCGADFQHVVAVWKGDCNALSNIYCVENPLRCDGYLSLGGLYAGQTYYLQVASQVSAAATASGDVCVRLLDANTPVDFSPLTFDIQEKCVDVDRAALTFSLNGGVQPYTISGNLDGEILPAGSNYFVVVSDAMGCEKAISRVVAPCQGSACNLAATLDITQPRCHDSADGAVALMVSGGVGPFTYEWSNAAFTADLVGLEGGTYTVTVTDALDCDQVVSAVLVAPPAVVIAPANIIQPSVGQSNGAIAVDITGGVGIVATNWYREGFLFAMGVEDLVSVPAGAYQLQAVDANGCMAVFNITLTETVGVADVSTTSFTEVYPNPAKDKTVLSVAFSQAQTLYLTLSDAAGRTIRTWTAYQVTEQDIPVDLRDLPAGAYQLRIVTGFETLTEKIVVVR